MCRLTLKLCVSRCTVNRAWLGVQSRSCRTPGGGARNPDGHTERANKDHSNYARSGMEIGIGASLVSVSV